MSTGNSRYCRVSTDDQNPALQLAALKKAGCTAIFRDAGISGAISRRSGLSRCLKKLGLATRWLV
jgi:DNA invertase Pin-like site-specific DNA recombinase